VRTVLRPGSARSREASLGPQALWENQIMSDEQLRQSLTELRSELERVEAEEAGFALGSMP